MSDEPKHETAQEWFERVTREHGPVPMRIGRRLAHLRKQQQAKATQAQQAGR